jgi:8-oxo-dGTP diphosphatase
MMEGRPKIGTGVIIIKDGKVLVLRRKGNHAPKYAIPGGHFEMGETFEESAKREMREELGIDLIDPKVIAVTNNLETYREEGKHYISVILLAEKFSGEPKIMESDKHEDMHWCDPRNLPEPFFDASRMGVECWLEGEFCKQSN